MFFIQFFVIDILFDYFDIPVIALIDFERVSWASEIKNDCLNL